MAATILRIATNPVEYMQAMDATQLASLADDVFKAVDFALQDAEPAMAPPEDGAPVIGSQETVVEALNTLRACAVVAQAFIGPAERAAPPALLATGRTPFAMHFNGPAGRYRLGWCAATLLRTAEEDEGAAGAYFVDLDAGGRRVPVARLCGGALASTATIGAAKGRSVTPTVPCDAPGQRRVECTNDHCKWA